MPGMRSGTFLAISANESRAMLSQPAPEAIKPSTAAAGDATSHSWKNSFRSLGSWPFIKNAIPPLASTSTHSDKRATRNARRRNESFSSLIALYSCGIASFPIPYCSWSLRHYAYNALFSIKVGVLVGTAAISGLVVVTAGARDGSLTLKWYPMGIEAAATTAAVTNNHLEVVIAV